MKASILSLLFQFVQSGRTKDDRLRLSFKPQIFEEAALMLGATAITLKYAGALDPLLKDSTFFGGYDVHSRPAILGMPLPLLTPWVTLLIDWRINSIIS